MLSSPIQYGLNSPASSSAVSAAADVAWVDAATANAPVAEVNFAPPTNLATDIRSELFAGQLSDVLTSTEQPLPEVASEQTAPQSQEQLEPNAEEWLLAMLDQQLLQVQTRDTPVAPSVGITATAQVPIDTVVLANVQQPVSATAPEKLSDGKKLSLLMPENVAHTGNINSGSDLKIALSGDAKITLSDKAFALSGKASANPSVTVATVNAISAADTSIADNSGSVALTNTTASVAMNVTASGAAPLTTPVASIESNSQLIVPAAVSGTGDNSTSRSVQSHLTLHAPEAKWGEQLLHALRDNVQVQIQQKIQSATIRLDPPELGSLEIYLSHESGRLTVNITASQADVARLIQTTSDRLRQELAGPQFTQVNVQSSAEGHSGQQQSRERQRSRGDEQILANEQPLVTSDQSTNRSGDVLVTV